jgi:hypothetical protein
MSATTETTKVMMTLAALAATSATERPSGETLIEHKARILKGINAQLNMTGLATNNLWTATWVGLTRSRANLAYLAFNPNVNLDGIADPLYALVLRGTMSASPIDTTEDMEVGQWFLFDAGGTPTQGETGNISQGAMEAFTDIVMGTDLIAALTAIAPRTLYVTGHSLGGAMVTTISLYLAAAGLVPTASIQPYTFAAPTAGDGNFAAWFDTQFPSAVCYINAYDLVPNAWATLQSLVDDYKTNPFYPDPPGPTAKPLNSVGAVILSEVSNANGNAYVQPTQQPPLNSGSSAVFLQNYPADATTEMQQFEVQVGYQHANNFYLTLLGAQQLPTTAPVVDSINPIGGVAAGGTSITIYPPANQTFSQDSVVDFGIIPAASWKVAEDGSTITAVSPPGIGTVDVRVTNEFGTSPAAPVFPNLTFNNYNDLFSYGGT